MQEIKSLGNPWSVLPDSGLGRELWSGAAHPASAAQAPNAVSCLSHPLTSHRLPYSLHTSRHEAGRLGENPMVKDLVWPGRLAFIIVATDDC